MKPKTNAYAATFLPWLASHKIQLPLVEFAWARAVGHPRNFMADFAWPSSMLLLEIQGGIFTKQAHGSITGLLKDMERDNLRALLKYRVIKVLAPAFKSKSKPGAPDLFSEETLQLIRGMI